MPDSFLRPARSCRQMAGRCRAVVVQDPAAGERCSRSGCGGGALVPGDFVHLLPRSRGGSRPACCRSCYRFGPGDSGGRISGAIRRLPGHGSGRRRTSLGMLTGEAPGPRPTAFTHPRDRRLGKQMSGNVMGRHPRPMARSCHGLWINAVRSRGQADERLGRAQGVWSKQESASSENQDQGIPCRRVPLGKSGLPPKPARSPRAQLQ